MPEITRKLSRATPGKLSVLTLSLSSALAVLTTLVPDVAQAQTTITSLSSSPQSWNTGDGDQVINSNSGFSVTNATALTTTGVIGAITNSGTVTSSSSIGLKNQGSITALLNNSGGTISGAGAGIQNYPSASIGTLINDGSILGSSGGYALMNLGLISTLVNNNLISANIGIVSTGNITELTNNGTIQSANVAIISSGTIATLTNTRLINSLSTAVVNASHGSIGTLINSGTIAANYTDTSAGIGLVNAGLITILNNTGLISGSRYGINDYVQGTISNLTNGGTIYGGIIGIYNEAVGSGTIVSNNSIGTLSNHGVISGGAIGISNYATSVASNRAIANSTISTLINNGIISGGTIGIYNYASANTSGVVINHASIGMLTNNGTISGGLTGIYSNNTIGTLHNNGLISGGSTALYLAAGSTLSSFSNAGVIAGAIDNASGTALTISGGSGTIFGTLTGASGGIGASDIGTITDTISSAGLTFGSGNQLLNDNINVGTSTVTNTGVLQVNNPLTITGNYVQGSGSTLAVGVTSPIFNGNLTDTGYGRLVVNGNATLDGSSVTVKAVGYSLARGQRYVVVAVTNGTLSTTGVTYSASGYGATGTIMADSNSAYTDLVVTLDGSITNHANNSNANAALSGLINYSGTNTGLLGVFNAMAALDTSDAANRAGSQLAPTAILGATRASSKATMLTISDVIMARTNDVRIQGNSFSGLASGETRHDIALWGQVFDGSAAQDMRNGISGYHGNYQGLLLGADGLVSEVLRAGGAFSFARNRVASDDYNTGSSASINNYGLSAYATYLGTPWYINAMTGVARQQYSTVRDISYTGFSGTANGSFNGQQYATFVQAGYPLNLDAWLPGATLTPLAGVRYSRLRQNGYTESGSAAALTVNASSSNSLKSELGARLERDFSTSYGKLRPSLELGWRHEFRDSAAQTSASFALDGTGSTTFVTQGVTPVTNAGMLSLGLTLLKSERLSLNTRYTLESGAGYSAQSGSVLVRWNY